MIEPATIALSPTDVELGVACAGTAFGSRTYAVGRKTFLFVSRTQARLKLDASSAEARDLVFGMARTAG